MSEKQIKLWAYYEKDGKIHNITTDEKYLRESKMWWSSAVIIEIDGKYSIPEIPDNSNQVLGNSE